MENNKGWAAHRDRYPLTKAKEQKKIMIEELMFNQMQQNLGKSIVDYVQSTRQTLQHVGLAKTRKIVLAVEKNLNKFMKGSYSDKIRLASDAYSSLKSAERPEEKCRSNGIFSQKLLEKELKKRNTHRHTMQEQGALRRNLITGGRKVRSPESSNVVVKDRRNECYSARYSNRRGDNK